MDKQTTNLGILSTTHLQERLWIDEHQVELEAILRDNHLQEPQEFANIVLCYICELSQAIQGTFYQANLDLETYQPIGAYAHSLSSKNKQTAGLGEGLVGQAILNNKNIHIQDIPIRQVQIKFPVRALLQPVELLIIPLAFNNKVYGALELFFSNHPEDRFLNLLDYFKGSIAATLETISHQDSMQRLLTDYQKQAAEMQAQEEELRQNLEELEAIQQTMRITQDELLRQKGLVDSLINNFDAIVYIVDASLHVLLCNQVAQHFYKARGCNFRLGTNLEDIFNPQEKEKFIPYIKQALDNKTKRIELSDNQNDAKWYSIYFFPIHSQKMEIIGVGIEIRDITDLRLQEKNLMVINEEMAIQAEELYRFNQEFEQQNIQLKNAYSKLERQNERITDSIRYAKTIQEAILPSQKRMLHDFSNLFVIYQAKDIVSGDFYWFTKLQGTIFVAVADCTGHGVPGALMSMMGNALLDEAVKGRHILTPAKVLDFIQRSFMRHLMKSTARTRHIDGLSISLCKIEVPQGSNKVTVTYAGSKSDMAYWSSTKQELVRLKGNRIRIGWKRNKDETFTQVSFNLLHKDILYLYTDGYSDTAGPNRKKIGSQNFLQILRQHAPLPLEEQQLLLETTLAKHLGGAELRDDVTVLGIQL